MWGLDCTLWTGSQQWKEMVPAPVICRHGSAAASTDPVALDSVFCHLVHLKPQMVPTNYHGEKMGLGTWKKEEIEILTPRRRISMEEAVHKYGNPEFHVESENYEARNLGKNGKSPEYFSEKTIH